MKILVINGANMNLLGKREPDIYGREDYAALCARIYAHAQSRGIAVECFQSNHEGAIIDAIQEADGMFDGIVINPGAYAHYSYAIRDAIKAITVPVVEVHISDIEKREEFRHLSVTAPVCIAQIRGHGFESYTMGIDLLAGEERSRFERAGRAVHHAGVRHLHARVALHPIADARLIAFQFIEQAVELAPIGIEPRSEQADFCVGIHKPYDFFDFCLNAKVARIETLRFLFLI